MQRFALLLTLLCFVVPAQAQATSASSSAAKANLTILADESMLLPLARIARHYAVETKTPLTIVVNDANDAEQRILQGLEAHLIITTNQPLIQRLAEQGLTDVSSRRHIARTQMALVTATDLTKQADLATRISFASILAATPTLPILMNEASLVEAQLIAQLSAEPDFAAALTSRLYPKPSHDEVVASLRDEPSLALMLAADAVAESDVNVVSMLPETISPSINVDAVVLGSEAMKEARNFNRYLLSRSAQATLAQFGYQAPAK